MSSVVCKRCGGAVVRRGFMYGYQRYGCKACGCHFTLAPAKRLTPAHKALAVLLYGAHKASYRGLAKLFGVSDVTIYRWVCAYAKALPEPVVRGDVTELELDEMWHFVGKKNGSAGFGRLMTVRLDAVWPGWSDVVTRRPAGNSGNK